MISESSHCQVLTTLNFYKWKYLVLSSSVYLGGCGYGGTGPHGCSGVIDKVLYECVSVNEL